MRLSEESPDHPKSEHVYQKRIYAGGKSTRKPENE